MPPPPPPSPSPDPDPDPKAPIRDWDWERRTPAPGPRAVAPPLCSACRPAVRRGDPPNMGDPGAGEEAWEALAAPPRAPDPTGDHNKEVEAEVWARPALGDPTLGDPRPTDPAVDTQGVPMGGGPPPPLPPPSRLPRLPPPTQDRHPCSSQVLGPALDVGPSLGAGTRPPAAWGTEGDVGAAAGDNAVPAARPARAREGRGPGT